MVPSRASTKSPLPVTASWQVVVSPKAASSPPDMLEEWKTFMDLAPLHNPPALKGYNAVKAVVENMPQTVFCV